MSRIPNSIFTSTDVTSLSQFLLGKQLCTNIGGELTCGKIVETEAYNGVIDRASHAYGGRNTNRTATLYELGGIAYIYLCYGIHHLFNIVSGPQDTPHAILIRGIEPTVGLDIMLRRRKMTVAKPNITAGPGALSMALGITRHLDKESLAEDMIWLEDMDDNLDPSTIVACPRVGVDYAGEDALLPYRYYLKGNKYVSKPNS